MLTDVQVQNFKVFEDTGRLHLKPITLLSGINSAGKSSIIQALLLLKQTLDSAPSLALAPGKGAWLEQSLGDNFNDFIFGRPDLEDATLAYTLGFAYDPAVDLDHMIEHLCLAIAQDPSNWLAENTQTLFVHAPDADHNSAWIEPVTITPYGEILNWPPHFLPDVAALDEAILKAGFAKQRKDKS